MIDTPAPPIPRLYLKERRAAAGLTQEALANACETTKGVISQLESGYMRYNADWLGKIAAALGIEPAELLLPPGVTLEHPGASATYLPRLLRVWERLTPGGQRAIAEIAEAMTRDTAGKPAPNDS